MKNSFKLTVVLMCFLMFAGCNQAQDAVNIQEPEDSQKNTENKETSVHIHSEEIIAAVPSTCTEIGLTEGKKCSSCGKNIVKQIEVPKKDHNYTITSTNESTHNLVCTSCGYEEERNHEWIYNEFDSGHQKNCSMCYHQIVESCIFSNGICLKCGAQQKVSEGLETATNYLGFHITGIGDCTDSDIVIPSEILGVPVYSIHYEAFENCTQITSITIPHSVKVIGKAAFKNCINLKKVTLPDNVRIDYSAFYNCTALESITLPEGVSFSLQNGYGSATTFYGCSNLKIVNLPKSLIEIPAGCFSNCVNLKEINLQDSIEVIGEAAFSNCESLSNVEFNANFKSLKKSAFSGCTSIATLVFPASTKEIGDLTFSGCSNLTSVTFLGAPRLNSLSVRQPFLNCERLTDIYYGGTAQEWVKNFNIQGITSDGKLGNAQVHFNNE